MPTIPGTVTTEEAAPNEPSPAPPIAAGGRGRTLSPKPQPHAARDTGAGRTVGPGLPAGPRAGPAGRRLTGVGWGSAREPGRARMGLRAIGPDRGASRKPAAPIQSTRPARRDVSQPADAAHARASPHRPIGMFR